MKKIITTTLSILSLLSIMAVCFTCLAVKAPAAVTKLTYTSTDSSITLSWSNVKATGYRVFRYNSSTKKWVKITTTTKTSATIKNLKPGTKAIYSVRPYNKEGSQIVWASSLTKTVAGTTPSTVSALTASPSAASIKLSWSKAAGATGYRVFRYNTSTKKWNICLKATSKTSATVSSLTSGKSYIFAVRPYYNTGDKILWASSFTSVKTTTLPAKPGSVKVTATSNTSFEIKWSKSSGATGYGVYSYNPLTKKYTKLTYTSGTSYAVDYIREGSYSYFVVRPYKKLDGKAYWGSMSSRVKNPLPIYQKFLRANPIFENFLILDIDGNGVNELIVRKNNKDSNRLVYTVRNGEVTNLGTVYSNQDELYYNSSLKALGTVSSGIGVYYTYELHSIVDNSLKKIAHCSFSHGYDPVTYEDTVTYTIDSIYNEVSKSSYDKYYKTYFTGLKTYSMITASDSNISKYV